MSRENDNNSQSPQLLNVLHGSKIVDNVDFRRSTVLKPCGIDKDNFFAISVLGFRHKNSWLLGARYTSWTNFELLGNRRVFCLKLFVILAFCNFSEFYSCHFKEERGFSNSWNSCNQYPILILDLFLLLNYFFLWSIDLVDVQNLDLLSYFSPKIYLILIGSVRCLNLVDMLKDFLIKSIIVYELFNLLDVRCAWLLFKLMRKTLQFRALFL